MSDTILGYSSLFAAIYYTITAVLAGYETDLYFNHMILAGILLAISILFDTRSICEKRNAKNLDV